MTVYRAAWICPIDQPPIRNGEIRVENGRIIAIGPSEFHSANSTYADDDLLIDQGEVVLLPGLVNAHTHLELSWLRGRVPPASQFTEWVKTMFAIRGRPDAAVSADQIASIRQAIIELQSTGTVAVGDIGNSLAAVGPMREVDLDGVVFHELLGFKERDGALLESTRALRTSATAAGARVSLAPHAPYSTSPELFRAIRDSVTGSACPIMSVHLGESPEESELLRSGGGPWRGILEFIGVWRDDWAIPACGPVEYLDRLGVIDAQTLIVHGVQFDDQALARLARLGATLVTCPRSNQWVGVGAPPIERFYRSGIAVAVGTDSLASVEDLNLFSELKAMRQIAPSVPASRLLASATLVGARALGLGDALGSLTPGKRAEIIAVDLPDGIEDVEEFLLSGVQMSQITWVE